MNQNSFIHSVAVNSLIMYFVLDSVLGAGNRVVYKAKTNLFLMEFPCQRERIKINACKIYTVLDNINM